MTKCNGCGIELQDNDINSLGYTDNLSNKLCNRCFRLTNYGEYKKVSLNNNDYTKIIKSIPNDSLVLYTTDFLSLNIDNIDKFKKVLLVITKRDIIPRSVKEYKIINKLKKILPNIIDIIIVSSINNYNIDELYNKLIKYSDNKDIYVVGYTNTGKSTLVNKLIKNYTNYNYKITESMYPSTTLDIVKIKLNNLTIIDTPGLIDENNIINYLEKEELKKVLPKSSINPKTCQINGKGSIIIDKYLRLDYETNNTNSIIIYSSRLLDIKFNSIDNNKYKEYNKYTFNIDKGKDIVIRGLCFIKTTKEIKINIYIKNIKPVIRENLI